MKLTDIYSGIIEAVGKQIDEDTFNVYSINPETDRKIISKIKLDGPPLPIRLPVRSVLEARDQSDYIGFHPLSESHIRAESAVNAWLRRTMAMRITATLGALLTELVQQAIAPDIKSSADPDLLPLLRAVNNADQKTADSFVSIMGKLDSGKRTLCNIFIKREGTIKDADGEDVKYERACITRFPLPLDDESKVFDVKMRVRKVKDVEILRDVLELILPGFETDAYCAGSNAKEAPNFKALLHSFLRVARKLNECTERYSSIIPDHEELLIRTDWAEHLPALPDMMDDIPSLPGNEGSSGSKPERGAVRSMNHMDESPYDAGPETRAPVQETSNANPYAQPVEQPPRQAAPAPVAAPGSRISSSDMLAARDTSMAPQSPQYHQPPPQYAPQQPHYAPQQPAYHQPQQPQYQQNTAPQYHHQQAAPSYYPQQAPAQGYYAPTPEPQLSKRDQARMHRERERTQPQQSVYNSPYAPARPY